MKTLSFIILAMALTMSGFAKSEKTSPELKNAAEPVVSTELNGFVIDKLSNEALVGVEVTLDGTNEKTYTDFDGQFKFKNLQPGKYKIVASYISYNMLVTEIDDLKNEEIKIELDAAQ